MRAAGNFVYILDQNQLELKKKDILQLLTVVSKNVETGPFKVRWNAAHALGNMYQNKLFVSIYHTSVPFKNSVFALIKSLESKNFKVRINAAQALFKLESELLCSDNRNMLCSKVKEIGTVKASNDEEKKYVDLLNIEVNLSLTEAWQTGIFYF